MLYRIPSAKLHHFFETTKYSSINVVIAMIYACRGYQVYDFAMFVSYIRIDHLRTR